jgi:hypothetical protein
MVTKKIYQETRTEQGINVDITVIELQIFGKVIYKKEYYRPFKTNELFNIKL